MQRPRVIILEDLKQKQTRELFNYMKRHMEEEQWQLQLVDKDTIAGTLRNNPGKIIVGDPKKIMDELGLKAVEVVLIRSVVVGGYGLNFFTGSSDKGKKICHTNLPFVIVCSSSVNKTFSESMRRSFWLYVTSMYFGSNYEKQLSLGLQPWGQNKKPKENSRQRPRKGNSKRESLLSDLFLY